MPYQLYTQGLVKETIAVGIINHIVNHFEKIIKMRLTVARYSGPYSMGPQSLST